MVEKLLHASVRSSPQQSHVISVDETVSDDAGTLRWSAARDWAVSQCEPAVTVTVVSGVREEGGTFVCRTARAGARGGVGAEQGR